MIRRALEVALDAAAAPAERGRRGVRPPRREYRPPTRHITLSGGVARALRRRLDLDVDYAEIRDALDGALGDLVAHPIDAEIVRTARIIVPPVLRSLDAIHLATAVLIGADIITTYDEPLVDAAAVVGLTAAAPLR